MPLVRIANLGELKEGQTLKFQFQDADRVIDGFAACFQGRILAYENRCRHLPLPLDYDDNRFFSSDGAHFVCQSHGALYDPRTGKCVRGPCAGARLRRIELKMHDGGIWITTDIAGVED